MVLGVTTNGEVLPVSVDWEDCLKEHEDITGFIGNECTLYEVVRPRRLYTQLHHKYVPDDEKSVVMLVDEEGLCKRNTYNLIGSYLYETDIHKNGIAGNIVFVGEERREDGLCLCDLPEKTFETLKTQLTNMAMAMRAHIKTMEDKR